MALKELPIDAEPLAGAMPAFCASVPAAELRGLAEQARARKARLVALWGSDETQRSAGYALHLALGFPSGLLWVSVPLSREDPHYPGIADIYPGANRMQRATADLLGIIPSARKG
jgi:Ni,Fe-hydrogenase III component G